MSYPRIMLAAPASGSGKTLVTCGLLQALVNRKKQVSAFKCGPDYIDPMFHKKVIGTPSRNLDTFFTDHETVRYLFAKAATGADLSVVEGVMGFYDGIAGTTADASSWDLAKALQAPVILIVNARGMSLSAAAMIRGFLEGPDGEEDSLIRGVILNQVSVSIYPEMKRMIEDLLPVQVLGYLPRVENCRIESRHLGLMMPDEIAGLKENLNRLAAVMEDTLDLDAILRLAEDAPDLDGSMPDHLKQFFRDYRIQKMPGVSQMLNSVESISELWQSAAPDAMAGFWQTMSEGSVNAFRQTLASNPVTAFFQVPDHDKTRIGLAMDEAFCFYYEDNLELLRDLGAELVPFSPIHDDRIPDDIHGILLGGGYPELYASQLSKNTSMLEAIRSAVQNGMPCIAECGGFMYLHESLEDMDGRTWPAVGVISARAFRTERLGRFGYITLTARKNQVYGKAGEQIRGHEFHYFDSTMNGETFQAQKPMRKKNWDCIIAEGHLAAGFPHLYYYSNPSFAASFVRACIQYDSNRS